MTELRRSLLIASVLVVLFAACGDKTVTLAGLDSPSPLASASAGASPGASGSPASTSGSISPTKEPAPTSPPVTPAPTLGYTSGSGIAGVVKAGPTCPVERADSPCPDQPVGGANVTITGSGYQRNTTTRSDGTFKAKAPPGSYTVHASSRFGCTDEHATVVAHHYTYVKIECDTGIR